jgi:hypothetical protein
VKRWPSCSLNHPRPKSIKDTLVRAAVSRPSSTVGQLQYALVFHSKKTGKEYKIFCNVNCKTPNVVYLIDCHVCGLQYVGESVQPFNKEWMDTEVTLRKRRSCPWVNILCRRSTHWMTLVDPKFISLTTIQVGKRFKDKKRESFWIRELRTVHSEGINKKTCIFCFLTFYPVPGP